MSTRSWGRELKNFGPWKRTENCLIFVLHEGTWYLEEFLVLKVWIWSFLKNMLSNRSGKREDLWWNINWPSCSIQISFSFNKSSFLNIGLVCASNALLFSILITRFCSNSMRRILVGYVSPQTITQYCR